MTSLTITIPLPPKACRPNGGHGNRYAKAEAKQTYRAQAWAAAKAALQRQPAPMWIKASVQVKAYFRTAQHLDPDNLIASLKSAFDGLADAKIIANDKGLWPERPEIAKDAKNPRIELTITEEI